MFKKFFKTVKDTVLSAKRTVKRMFRKPNAKIMRKVLAVAAILVVAVSMMSFFSFASPTTADSYTLTPEMLEPVLEGAAANVAVIVPVGIGLFVILLGVSLIVIVFTKFVRR